MVSVMRRVAAISAGPRSASPRGSRARSFWGFFGFSAMGGVGTSAGTMRQPRLLLPLPQAGEGADQRPESSFPGCCAARRSSRRGALQIRGPRATIGAVMGPGSAEQREERCTASGTREPLLRRGGLALGLHFGGVVGHQLFRDGARLELPLRDLRHRRDLGGGAGDEALAEAQEFLRHDAALDHLDAAAFGEVDRGGAGDAGEEAVGYGSMNLAILDEEDVDRKSVV